MKFKKIVIITGHYGCGKTNIAVNLALALAKEGEPVTIVDLDIVNPYYRTNDCREILDNHGVEVLAANFASTNLDVPSLPASIPAKIRMGQGTLILDVGGDDAGAIALGQYASMIAEREYDLFYVYNPYRYLTAEPEETVGSLRDIEAASRLKATALVNNANLGPLTTRETVKSGLDFGRRMTELTGLPVAFTACEEKNDPQTEGAVIVPMELYIRPVE